MEISNQNPSTITKEANALSADLAKLPDPQFLAKIKDFLGNKMTGYKTFGAMAGASAGSGIGASYGMYQKYKDDKAGKMEGMDKKEKIKEYLKASLKPGLYGMAGGAGAGIFGGRMLRNANLDKYTEEFARRLKRNKALTALDYDETRSYQSFNKLMELAKGKHVEEYIKAHPEMNNPEGLKFIQEQMSHPHYRGVLEQDVLKNNGIFSMPRNEGIIDQIGKELTLDEANALKDVDLSPMRIIKDRFKKTAEENIFKQTEPKKDKKENSPLDELANKHKSKPSSSIAAAHDFNKVYHNKNTKLMKAVDKRKKEYSVNTAHKTPGLKLAEHLDNINTAEGLMSLYMNMVKSAQMTPALEKSLREYIVTNLA